MDWWCVMCTANTVRAAAAEWRGTEAREARERQHARKPFAQAVKGDGGGGLHDAHLRLRQRRLHARRAARRAALDSSKSCEAHEKTRGRETQRHERQETQMSAPLALSQRRKSSTIVDECESDLRRRRTPAAASMAAARTLPFDGFDG